MMPISNPQLRMFLAEWLGTFFLVLASLSATASKVLNNPDANLIDPNSMAPMEVFHINFLTGLGAYVGLLTSMNAAGGLMNPAITVARATRGKIPWRRVPLLVSAQYVGALAAPLASYIGHLDEWNRHHPKIGNSNMRDPEAHDYNRTAMAWANVPSRNLIGVPDPFDPSISYGDRCQYEDIFFNEFVGTAVLAIAYEAFMSRQNTYMPNWLRPLTMGFARFAVGQAFYLQTGGVLNPARDLSPRIMMLIFGWTPQSAFGNYCSHWILAGHLGPYLGAMAGMWVLFFFIEMGIPKDLAQQQAITHAYATKDYPATK